MLRARPAIRCLSSPLRRGPCAYSTKADAPSPAAHKEEELAHARRFLQGFSPDAIPRSIGSLGFSRSSGPGGQNVNKVNSKATLKVDLDDLFQLLPRMLHAEILKSPHCTSRSRQIVISSDESRKQGANVDNCFAKLYDLVAHAARSSVPGETSLEQKKHVQDLAHAQDRARLREKKQHSSKKQTRRSRSDD